MDDRKKGHILTNESLNNIVKLISDYQNRMQQAQFGDGMGKITVNIPNDRMKELRKQSQRLNVSMEDLVLLSIQEFLKQPDDNFQHAMEYVLDKNSELYQRLAR